APAAPPAVREAAAAAPASAPVADVPAAEAPAAPRVALGTAPPQSAMTLSATDELTQHLVNLDRAGSARTATHTVLTAWGERPLASEPTNVPSELESLAWRYGLQELSLTSNRSMLRLLDLPALVVLHPAGATEPRFAALIEMDATNAVISVEGVTTTVTADLLDQMWSGEAYLFWRDFDGLG